MAEWFYMTLYSFMLILINNLALQVFIGAQNAIWGNSMAMA